MLANVVNGELCGCGLGGANFSEGKEEIVVNCATVIEEGAKYGLDAFEAGVVEFGAGVERVVELLLGAIVDWGVAKRSVSRFGWKGMDPFE